jgi:hypothetical protein
VRLKYALFVLLFTTPFMIAQEDPLPAVTLRAAAGPEVMLIATAVEPIREINAPTLAEAARLNDYNTFDTLYREARQRGENVSQYTTLHELWTYAMTNPIGSFYGEEMYERLARVYPGYAEFIDQHRIVDSRGNVFYPTSETRGFVLERAVEGRAPRVMVAGDGLTGPRPAARVQVAGDGLQPPRPAPVAATVQPAAGLRARPSRKTEEAPAAAPPSSLERRALSPSAPVVVAETPAVTPVVETAPAPVPAPVAVQPPPAPIAAAQPESSSSSRGILLIVIGLLGVGLLAVMFRTPQETTLPPIINVKPEEKPAAPVEPLRRPEGPQPAPKNRATGSHG